MGEQLVGKFHAHITLNVDKDVNFLPPKGWKITIILLNKGEREQKDVMITRHFVWGTAKTPRMDDIMVELSKAKWEMERAGYEVIRVKLEHESLPTLTPSVTNYRECHIKIKKPVGYDLIAPAGYVESRNAMEVTDTHTTTFLNARYYKGTVQQVDREMDGAFVYISLNNPECEVIDVKKETTVYDTNLNLDKWWA